MSRLSVYVQHLLRHNAQALLLTSGEPAVMRFAEGDRRANQAVDHAQLVSMIQEAAPSDVLAEIRANRTARFPLLEQGIPFDVEVVPGRERWRVNVSPSKASPVGSAMPPAAAAASSAATHPSMQHPVQQRGAGRESIHETHAPQGNAPRTGLPSRLDRWLELLAQRGGSDLHLTTGMPPLCRLHGQIGPLEPGEALTHVELKEMLFATMPDHNRDELERLHDTDWAYEIAGLARFRGNAFFDRHGVGAVFRRIPYEILSAEQIGLPRQVLDLCNLTKGLVLVTGPTGSGKSTTLATLIDVVNSSRDDHIITIEDPIEFVHENKRCLVNQREIRTHTGSFKTALRAALREDPDVVLVGEMRDLETIAIAIETAETGHLVFGTLHTTTAPSAVDRIIDQFPADRQAQIRTMLSESLKGVIAQVLCKKKGGGRVAAYEILIGVPAVANLIREGKTFQIPSTMQTSRNVGMCTMNDSLIELVKRGVVEPKEAYMKSVSKTEMKSLLTQGGFPVP